MKTRSFTIFLAISIVIVESAIISKRDSIPVRVVYEGRVYPSVRNLDQVQSREDSVADQSLYGSSREIETPPAYLKGINNLAEKPQLSSEEIKVAVKHLPKPIDPSLEVQSVKSIDETKLEDDKTEQQENGALFNQIKQIIYTGLDNIHSSVNKLANSMGKPVEEAWKNFNETVAQLLETQQKTVVLKQANNEDQKPPNENPNQKPPNENQNQNQFFQNLVTNFQNAANNFVQNLQQNRPPNGNEDEQTGGGGGWGQNVISSIQGGFQQVVNNINSLTGQSATSNPTLGDTGVGATTQSSIFGNVVSSFQQIFSGNPVQSSANQSDTGVGSTAQPGIFQGVINQINQVANNFRPTPPPASQGDEGTTTQRGPVQFIQQIGNQIGSIFGQSTSKPPGSEDEGTQVTQSTNFIQNIGQALQNANPFRPPQQQQPQQQHQPQQGQQPGGAGSNPISSGVQAVGNQIQQGIQNAVNQNPLGFTTEKGDDAKKGSTVETVTTEKENLATTTLGEKKEIMETTE